MGTQVHSKTDSDVISRLMTWADANRRTAIGVGAAIVILGGGTWFWMSAKARREAFASRDLQQARAAATAGNLPLATNDLSRVADRYSGTAAAEEAAIALAQIRLLQGQSDLAIAGLRSLVARSLRAEFRGPAYGLLGAALEQTGQTAEAAKTYELAAEAAAYSFLKSQNLVDAGRAYWTAGDTAHAARAYERVLKDFKQTPGALEARVRLAELRKGATGIPT